MIVRVPGMLDADRLAAVTAFMATGKFVDGRRSGGPAVQDVKNNLQLDRDVSPGVADAAAIVLGALGAHATVRAAVLPKRRVLPPYYTKYTEGMGYGPHVDNPLMAAAGGTPPLRTDVSFTLFLTPPDSYDGGELQDKGELGDA
ncbi:MAG: PKHD-type hydroxylase, partial [Rhodospirillaceae bacterium]